MFVREHSFTCFKYIFFPTALHVWTCGILEWAFFPNFSFLWGLFLWIHQESVRCQIHICQLNSKGNTGSQTCISGVVLIFIAGMVGFRRNSTTMKLAPLGHRVNTHGDPCSRQKHTKQKKNLSIFYWLQTENSLFTHVGFHCTIVTRCVFTDLIAVSTTLMELLQVVFTNTAVALLAYNRIYCSYSFLSNVLVSSTMKKIYNIG